MIDRIDAGTFRKLLAEVSEVGRLYDGVVFIGGIAVYLHAINHEATSAYAESTRDADFYISLSSLSDLREIEELTPNSRLSKHEFKRRGMFSFDVYAERHSTLPVPYDAVAAHAVQYDGVSVAALEDLLVLKLEAAVDRHGSEHGRKDAKDVIRLLLLATEMAFDASRAVAHMRPAHFERLGLIVKGPEFTAMAEGNVKVAKALRQAATAVFAQISAAYGEEHEGGSGS
jgi:hypothetical protein